MTLDLDFEELLSVEGFEADSAEFLRWQDEVAPASGVRSLQPILVVQGLSNTSILPYFHHQGLQGVLFRW
jgi:hypothetical protein